MHAGSHYNIRQFLVWTSRNIVWLAVIAVIPTALYDLLDWRWLAIPWQPVALVGTAAAFIAGFKNTQTYNRLWEARKIWGAIINDSRTWGVVARDFVTHSKMSVQDIERIHHRLIYRHMALVTALRYQLRTPQDWENTNKPYFTRYLKYYSVPEWETDLEMAIKPFLSDEELEYILTTQNPATQLLSLQSSDLKNILEQDCINTYQHVEMMGLIKLFYTHQGRAERIKKFPYPRQFASINMFFIVLFSILVPFGMLDEFDKLGDHGVWLTIPFSVVVGWVFTSLEQVGESTENPFEGGANDIPMYALSRTIEIDLREMLGETDLPVPVSPVNKILM